MYSASEDFHTAVAQGKPQKALLIFPNAFFGNDDINIENGIALNDYFSAEDDLNIGQALSNELTFSLFNDDRLLNDYAFGDFLATIGVLINSGTYTQTGNVQATTGNATYVGYNSNPYLKRNNLAVATQPTFQVKSILAYDGKVYVCGANQQCKVYRDSDGADITSSTTVPTFMKVRSKGWAGRGMNYDKSSRILTEWKGGKTEQYEFVPLGYFTAKRPNVPDVIQINFTCNDFMMKFEKDMPDAATLGITYPSTISNLFVKLCNYAGVSYESSTFINSTATIVKQPSEFSNCTMRQVLKWIAEAAASNLRFNRDGQLVFDWLHETEQEFDESGYSDFNPYWYETPKVTKLINRDSLGGTDSNVGTGSNAYLIQDNPLLKGVTASE